MSTPSQPPNYHSNVGGTLMVPQQPDVLTYPLRPDQFLTIRDGEMSASRSMRDACTGAFLAAAVGTAGVYLTIDWDVATKQGRHPMLWMIILCSLTIVAFAVGLIEWIRMYHTERRSTYSRLIETMAEYFGLED